MIAAAILEALVLYKGQGLLHEEVFQEAFHPMDPPNASGGAGVLVNVTPMLDDTYPVLQSDLL